jgi:cell division protein ZapE
MPDVFSRYEAMAARGEIEADPAQIAVARRLTDLSRRLSEHRLARKSSALGWVFSRREVRQAPIRGLYIHGSVGRGKTMLMDWFFETARIQRKRRAHFHAFMLDVHARVHAARADIKAGRIKGDDPIAPVAAALADEAWLICFDEFHVTDIADAMILGRLFTRLFEAGVVLVTTSNVRPVDLYKDGLNRALFLPFLDLLAQHVDVVELDARTDYRLEKLAGAPVWHAPANHTAEAALQGAWDRLTGHDAGRAVDLDVQGRILTVPKAAMGVARFTFEDLCARPLGAADYLTLARTFHTVILAGIPVMDLARRNEARRFVTLIDALYENGVKLVASAADQPATLYVADTGYEAFAFDRTVSRLTEMQSQSYLALPHGQRDSAASGDTTGLVET